MTDASARWRRVEEPCHANHRGLELAVAVQEMMSASLVVASLEKAHILQIDRAPGSPFGANQICARHDVEGLALVIHRNSVRPGIVEGEAWHRRPRVDTDAILEDRDLVGQSLVRTRQGSGAQSGGEERIDQALRVVPRGIDQDVEIERGSRDPVQHSRDAADHDVPNVMPIQGREYVLKSIEHGADVRGGDWP